MMIRSLIAVTRAIRPLATSKNSSGILLNACKSYSTLRRNIISSPPISQIPNINIGLSNNKQILSIYNSLNPVPLRTVTKFSYKKGKRKTVKAAVNRFFRLHWGIWIRTRVGKNKKMWKKTSNNRRRLRQHIFCNATQSTLLDKMVTKYWKRPKYYVDDPYTPYHTREEFTYTRKQPL